MERVGEHVRRGQGHHHRRREPHVRAGAASGSPRLVIQEAWAWLTATQLVRASAAAALRSEAAAARALRRTNGGPVTADEESFTAVRHHAIRAMTSTQVTASASLEALAAAADAAARAALHALNVPGRERHAQRAQKARPKFRHTAQPSRPSRETPGHRLRARHQVSRAGQHRRQEEEPPRHAGRGPRNRAPGPPRHAGKSHIRTPPPPSRKQTQRQKQNTKAVTP